MARCVLFCSWVSKIVYINVKGDGSKPSIYKAGGERSCLQASVSLQCITVEQIGGCPES